MTHPDSRRRTTPFPSPSPPPSTRPVVPAFPGASAPLEAVAVAFSWLTTGPHPVTLDTTTFPGLPDRAVALDELRTRLLSPGCAPAVREAVWAELIARAHRPHPEGATWTLACAGMALPVLIRVAHRLTARFVGDPADIDAAVLTGFLHGLGGVHPDQPHVLASLRWRAFRAGMTALREALTAPTPTPIIDPNTTGPTRTGTTRTGTTGTGTTRSGSVPAVVLAPFPAGHPDFVLARAVTDGILTSDEAALIAATRLEHLPLADAAHARGQTYRRTYTIRRRSERRLLTYLTRTEPPTATSDTDTDTDTESARRARTRSRPPTAPTGRAVPASTTRPDASAPAIPDASTAGAPPPPPTAGTSPGSSPVSGSAAITRPDRAQPPQAGQTRSGQPRSGPTRRAGHRGVAGLFVVVLVGLVCAVLSTLGAPTASALPRLGSGEPEVVLAQVASVEQVLTNIRNWLIGILAAVATVFATIGGIRRTMSDGDPAEIERANRALRSAAIGYAIAALAPLIVTVLQGLVGL